MLSIDDERLELVIQDNSDGTELETFVKSLPKDERLRYTHETGELSFVANFERALAAATGEYCCIIGDDDGVHEHILTCAQWMKENGVQAVQYNLRAFYLWPDITLKHHLRTTKQGGYFNLATPSLRIKNINVEKQFRKLLRNGGQDYLRLHLPKLYHGIVETAVLHALKAERKVLFGGLSPDMYITSLLSMHIKNLVYIDYPFTLSGVASGSGSAESGQNKHVGSYDDMPHLRGHSNYHWNGLVPKFYSVQTVWADSMLAAITDERRYDLLRHVNLFRLSAYCLVYNKKYWPYVRTCMDAVFQNGGLWTLRLPFSILAGPGLTLITQAWGRISKTGRRSYTVQNVKDSVEAAALTAQRLEKLGLSQRLIGEKCSKRS